MHTNPWAFALLYIVVAGGCAGLANAPSTPQSDAEAAVGKARYQPMLVDALPPLALDTAGGTALQAMVGRDTQITDLMLALFKDSDINLLVDDNVDTGTVTFDIKASTVEEVFEAMLRSRDLAYEWDGSFLRIRSTVRETFRIDLLNSSSGGGSEGGNSSGSSGAQTDFWGELEASVGQLVGDGGQVLINRTAGTVHVEASPSSIERIREFLTTTQQRATQQVSLEARILEVRLSDEFRLGVNWSLLPGLFNTSKTGLAGGNSIVSQTALSGGSSLTFGFLEANDISLVVDALEAMGQVRVLSSPRISTMNNVPATLEVLDRIPILDREVIDSQGGVRTEFDIRFIDAGVSVGVTPQIGDDGMITVRVAPQITEQVGTITTPDGSLTEPILSTRSASTVVRVPDGQAIAIGGLRSTRKGESVTGVPFLSQIPWLGQLFHSTVQTREEVELMVILVPRRLDSSWVDEAVRRGAHRLVSLRRGFKFGSIDLDDLRPEDWRGGVLQGHPSAPTEPILRPVANASAAPPVIAGTTITRAGLATRLMRQARTAVDAGDVNRAVAKLQRAVALDPERVETLVATGILLGRQGQLEAARRMLDNALTIAPDSPFALVAKGNLEVLSGAPRAAQRLLQSAHAAIDEPWTASNLAATHLLLGEIEQARSILSNAASDDAPPELFANLAFAEFALGHIDAAAGMLERALANGADPRNPHVHALVRMIREGTAESTAAQAADRDG